MDTRPRVVLVPSPLTGPLLWSGVCDALWRHNCRASVARIVDSEFAQPPFWLMHAASIAALLPAEGDVVLVAHSGAGVLLPAIGRFNRNRRTHGRVCGYVFVDCDLPRDGCSRFDLFDDAAARDALRATAARGWLPRWESGQLARLIPDAQLCARFAGALPRVPVALYEERVSVPDDWPDAGCAYLQLSAAYPSAVAAARAAGWPLARLDSHHLAPLAEPQAVTKALITLIDALPVH